MSLRSTANAVSHSLNLVSLLRRSEKHSALNISPNELDLLSIFLFIFLFIARSLKHAIGLGVDFAHATTSDGHDPSPRQHQQLFTLPDLSLSMPLNLGPADREAFANAIGSAADHDGRPDHLQVSLFLAAASEPALLLLLAKRNCPVRPLGSVNVRNRFEIFNPEICYGLFSSTNKHKFYVLAKFSGPARRVRRGIEIDVVVDIVCSSSPSPSGISPYHGDSGVVFRQVFTMLQFVKFASPFSPTQQPPPPASTATTNGKDSDAVATATMSSTSPRLWAKLCKDYNPIHFSRLCGFGFGQPGQLAHGNHAVAVLLPLLTTTTTTTATKPFNESSSSFSNGNEKTWWAEIKFKRPIVLPATIIAAAAKRTRTVPMKNVDVGRHGGGGEEGDGEEEEGESGFDVVDTATNKVCVEVKTKYL